MASGLKSGIVFLSVVSMSPASALTLDFNYTGAAQSWVVPAGVTSVTIEAWGAQGGDSYCCDGSYDIDGGLGGYATGTLTVTPGETLDIRVGGKAARSNLGGLGGFNGGADFGQYGGGGGGGSDVRRGGNLLTNRVIVGGGGGGGNCGCPNHGTGGAAGGLVGSNGIPLTGHNPPAGGGTQVSGGTAGAPPGQAGGFGVGGGPNSYHVAGGGGGWYGGGGAFAAGGGGGSSYIGGVSGGSTTGAVRSGNGLVRITVPQVCGNGVLEGSEVCDDGNTLNGDCCSSTCQFESSSVVCRASAGTCDLAENCTGSSGTCPADAKSTAQCRAAAGACDVAESCDGVSNNCPVDVKSTAQCRASGGVCDVAEFCDGVNNSCAADAFASSGVCRPVAGVCDTAESCDGSGPNCPADAFLTSSECRASAGFCDVAESCDGSGAACPPDAFQPSTVECRAASLGETCDVAENCTGSSADCPADGFVAMGTPCRAAANDCDVAEACTGSSASCPADAKEPSGTGCDDGSTCTQTDQCDGAGTCVGIDPLDCDDGDACTADSCDPMGGCVNNDAPATGCLTAGKSIILIKNASDDSKDKLLWKWIKGGAMTQGDLADPQDTTVYALCVYAGTTNALVAEAALPTGTSGWSAVGDKGYKFKGTSPAGLSLALLKGGAAGKSKALAKGKGAALPDPVLPLTYPVMVQLKKDGGPLCLESTFTAADEKKNDAEQFKAKK